MCDNDANKQRGTNKRATTHTKVKHAGCKVDRQGDTRTLLPNLTCLLEYLVQNLV